jgi:hypothetical protein
VYTHHFLQTRSSEHDPQRLELKNSRKTSSLRRQNLVFSHSRSSLENNNQSKNKAETMGVVELAVILYASTKLVHSAKQKWFEDFGKLVKFEFLMKNERKKKLFGRVLFLFENEDFGRFFG